MFWSLALQMLTKGIVRMQAVQNRSSLRSSAVGTLQPIFERHVARGALALHRLDTGPVHARDQEGGMKG